MTVLEQQKANTGHRERMREEFIKVGFNELPDYKILEMLLFYGIPRKDTRVLAKTLLETFGSISGVLEADVEDLKNIKGMTTNAACLIKLILPLAKKYSGSKIGKKATHLHSYEEIGDFVVGEFFGESNEKAILVCLDRKGKVLGVKVLADGDFDSAGISIRSIMTHIVQTNATSVVLAHNHPSGVALPSAEDVCVTRQIMGALNAISVNFIDHIIVTGDDYVSMAQSEEFSDIFGK